MFVDAHQHLWRLDRGYRWLDADVLAPIRRDYTGTDLTGVTAEAGVAATVLVEAGRGDWAEAPEFLEIAGQTPVIAGVVAWCDFADPDPVARLLAACRAERRPAALVGVRDQVQGHADPDRLARPEVLAGLRSIAEAGLAVDLVIRADQLPGAVVAADAVPGARFVLDHLAKPPLTGGPAALAVWRDGLARLAERPNVVAKLSGLVTEVDWAQWTTADLSAAAAPAYAAFGPDRLLWGSDWPLCELAGGYHRWLAAARELVPPVDHAAVFGGNAVRTYHLEISR